MVAEVDEFLAGMLPRQIAAEKALCQGDAAPRRQTWSQREPVTVFGASGVPVRRGWDEVSTLFEDLAGRFSGVQAYELELVAAGASGDLAYTAGLEHKTAVIDGETVTYTLRVTHVYRREDGVWRTVHRHGDHVDQGFGRS
ncbi:MAG: nuclear transport factor 2 family protein [Pseudonocardia sp.]|nr:nuclear transport factor 2 family protein [Pseudonocardia sp.]